MICRPSVKRSNALVEYRKTVGGSDGCVRPKLRKMDTEVRAVYILHEIDCYTKSCRHEARAHTVRALTRGMSD